MSLLLVLLLFVSFVKKMCMCTLVQVFLGVFCIALCAVSKGALQSAPFLIVCVLCTRCTFVFQIFFFFFTGIHFIINSRGYFCLSPFLEAGCPASSGSGVLFTF